MVFGGARFAGLSTTWISCEPYSSKGMTYVWMRFGATSVDVPVPAAFVNMRGASAECEMPAMLAFASPGSRWHGYALI